MSLNVVFFCLVGTGTFGLPGSGRAAEDAPAELSCAIPSHPLGLEIHQPYFGWRAPGQQRAYQVLVASTAARLNADVGDFWDSGRVPSSTTTKVLYAGLPLQAGTTYWWKVRVWSAAAKPGAFSAPAPIATPDRVRRQVVRLPRGQPAGGPLKVVPGRHGKAVHLNGKDQCIRIRHDRRLHPVRGITVCAWIRPKPHADDWAEIYRKEDGSARQLLAIGRTGEIDGLWLGLGIDGSYREFGARLAPDKLMDGAWHFVAGTYDGGHLKLFADGQEIGRMAIRGRIDRDTTGAPAFIGSFEGRSEFFHGAVDDVRLYDAALSEDDLQKLADGGHPAKAARLVGHWRLDGDLENAAAHRPERAPDHRVVFLGNTIFSRAIRHSFLETSLTVRWPTHDLTFRNLGWPADDVTGRARSEFGSDRNTRSWRPPARTDTGFGLRVLLEQVSDANPAVLLVAYGANATFGGGTNMETFESGLTHLLDGLARTGAKIILLSPPKQEFHGPPLPDPAARNRHLEQVTEILKRAAAKRGHGFVDLNAHLFPSATPKGRVLLTTNGIHLTAEGYRRMGRIVETELGLPPQTWTLALSARDGVLASAGTQVEKLQLGTEALSFTLRDRHLPSPLAENGGRVFRIRDLTPGRYALKVDGRLVASASDIEWSRGVALESGPEFEAAGRLRRTIREKNELNAYVLRPFNKTYVSLFRRHEMGHLAYEKSVFHELVSEKEAVIAQLRKPTPHHYRLVRERAWHPPRRYPDHEVPRNIPSPDVRAEWKAFRTAQGIRINLFSADPLIANPNNLNWDVRGRLWITSNTTYPHIKPGAQPNARIVVLEDVDEDGRADRATVFAEGLRFPHSVLPDAPRGRAGIGAYVADATELLYLADTNGDGRADQRRVLFSGFGNADVHHMIHGLRGGPDGWIYFNQSIYINSFVETPYGVRRLNGSGIWRFHPATQRLDVHARGMVNPWGLAFDFWGQSFATDGAGGGGIHYVFPGAAFPTAVNAPRVLRGLNPGRPKEAGLEVASGRSLPASWRGSLLTCDFRANRVTRYVLREEGSGFSSRLAGDVVRSTHRSFRPVDVKMGPDGALYIVDWYNAIIDHGEVDFHHPLRDKSHGRIWRITFDGEPRVRPPRIVGAPVKDLLDALKLPEDWTRTHARREIVQRGAEAVVPALAAWVRNLDSAAAAFEHHRLEALWVHQGLRVVQPTYLRAVLKSKDHRARAAAVRVLGEWHERMPDALKLLAEAVADDHPRVRLEAVNALRRIPSADSAAVATRVLDRPMDKNLKYAAWLTVRELKPRWLPALEAGKEVFGGNSKRLAFALNAIGNPAVGPALIERIRRGEIAGTDRRRAIQRIAKLGNAAEWGRVLDLAMTDINVLRDLDHASRHISRPPKNAAKLVALLDDQSSEKRTIAARLCGRWRLSGARETLRLRAGDANRGQAERLAAARGYLWLNPKAHVRDLARLAAGARPRTVRSTAVAAWAEADLPGAARSAGALLGDMTSKDDPTPIFQAFLGRRGGAKLLAATIQNKTLNRAIAQAGVRMAESSGRDQAALIRVLIERGGLRPIGTVPVAVEQDRLIAEVKERGNPARGEVVFRRKQLACLHCHAIGGAGGRLGPELGSLGNVAPPQDILDSILNPSARIKEGYNTVVVTRKDGTVLSGILQRKTDAEALIRLAADAVMAVPLADIETIDQSPVSLMPPGLTASLKRDELVDLISFLRALGKDAAFSVPNRRLVRRWVSGQQTLYATVAGELPIEEFNALEPLENGNGRSIQFEIEVNQPGRIGLQFREPIGLRLRLNDGTTMDAKTRTILEYKKGRHRVSLLVAAQRKAPLHIELIDVPGSLARARIVNGQ